MILVFYIGPGDDKSQSGPDMNGEGGGRQQLPGLTNRQSVPGWKKRPPALRGAWQPDPLVPASFGQGEKMGASFVPQRSDHRITASLAEWPGPAPHTGIGVEGSPHPTRSQSCVTCVVVSTCRSRCVCQRGTASCVWSPLYIDPGLCLASSRCCM